jgi:hypothetical protein
LAETIDEVVLRQFKAKGAGGRALWWPVGARYRSFVVDVQTFSETPVIISTFALLQETMEIDRPIDDKTFSVYHRHGVTQSPQLGRLERQFKTVRQPPRTVVDQKKRLAEMLVEANRQAKELDASGESDANRWLGGIWAGLGGLGVVCIGIALYLRIRVR